MFENQAVIKTSGIGIKEERTIVLHIFEWSTIVDAGGIHVHRYSRREGMACEERLYDDDI